MSFDDIAPGPALPPLHPGEILMEDFMKPMGLSVGQLAEELGMIRYQLGMIINKADAINADMAIRLAGRFGTSVDFWVKLQKQYDVAMRKRVCD